MDPLALAALAIALGFIAIPPVAGYSTGSLRLASLPPLGLGAAMALSQARVGEDLALLAVPIATLGVLGALAGWAGVRFRRIRESRR